MEVLSTRKGAFSKNALGKIQTEEGCLLVSNGSENNVEHRVTVLDGFVNLFPIEPVVSTADGVYFRAEKSTVVDYPSFSNSGTDFDPTTRLSSLAFFSRTDVGEWQDH